MSLLDTNPLVAIALRSLIYTVQVLPL